MTHSPETQAPAPTRERTALLILLADAQALHPASARAAAIYLEGLRLPDVWHTALARVLDARAGDTPQATLDALAPVLGRPGAWLLDSVRLSKAYDARLWLASVQALAAEYAPLPPPTR